MRAGRVGWVVPMLLAAAAAAQAAPAEKASLPATVEQPSGNQQGQSCQRKRDVEIELVPLRSWSAGFELSLFQCLS